MNCFFQPGLYTTLTPTQSMMTVGERQQAEKYKLHYSAILLEDNSTYSEQWKDLNMDGGQIYTKQKNKIQVDADCNGYQQ